LPGGAVAPTAQVFDGAPIVLTHSTLVKTRARQGGEWSAINQAHFSVAQLAAADNLAITELNYNPYQPTPDELLAGFRDKDDFEFVELRNTSSEPVNLNGVEFTAGIDFTFGDNSQFVELAPGEHLVVVSNPLAFAARYGSEGFFVAGAYDGNLRNEGERITLLDSVGQTIADFEYDDSNDWPGRADGKGASLGLIDPTGGLSLGDPQAWRSSSEYGGSPGSQGTGPLGDVLINEVLTHTDIPLTDAIELYNTTGAPIDLGGWYLSDSWGWRGNDNYKKFRIPDGTTLAAHGYLVFDEDDFNPTPLQPGPNDFALNGAHGDDVWLMEADAAGNLLRFVDHVDFPAAANGESLGRWPNGEGEMYPMIERTLDPDDGLNSGPRVGPVIISEVMYDANRLDEADEQYDFIEVYNPTATAVDLTNWRIRKTVDYDFPAGTLLAAHSALLVVPFDPQDSAMLANFCDYYALSQPVQILGGYSGNLGEEAGRVQLQRPDLPPADEADFFPRLLEDEMTYDAQWPDLTAAAGGGNSLNRRADDAWGHDQASWLAVAPTPGTTPLLSAAGVNGRYVFYNNSAFDGHRAAADAQDDQAIADKAALLPGEVATFANYTSYSAGINGIMVDICGLAEGAVLDDDFTFRTGNSKQPGAWAAAPGPSQITVRPGSGAGGSDRVTITWPDNAISNTWLQVTVLDTPDTGLSAADVFYFGNAIGDTGNSPTDARVNASDMLLARNNPRSFLNPASIDLACDFNRDARVNATDMLIARNNQTHFLNALELIDVPDSKDEAGAATASYQYELVQLAGKARRQAKRSSLEVAVDELLGTEHQA